MRKNKNKNTLKKSNLRNKGELHSDKSMGRRKIKENIPSKMNKVSETNRGRNERYKELREAYKSEHPKCEICKKKKATSIHHKAGRTGDNLFKYFMALCWNCHRFVHDNVNWAKEEGYLLNDNGERFEVEEGEDGEDW